MARQLNAQIDSDYYERVKTKSKYTKCMSYDESLLRDLAVEYNLSMDEIKSIIGKTEQETHENIINYRKTHTPLNDSLIPRNVIKNTPYGYDRINGKLIPNENELGVIVIMLQMCKDGMTYTDIAKTLNERGIPTKTGDVFWRYNVIKRLINRHNKQVDL